MPLVERTHYLALHFLHVLVDANTFLRLSPSVGPPNPGPGLISLTSTVSASLPSLCHNSLQVVASSATKNSVSLTLVSSQGSELCALRLMSLTKKGSCAKTSSIDENTSQVPNAEPIAFSRLSREFRLDYRLTVSPNVGTTLDLNPPSFKRTRTFPKNITRSEGAALKPKAALIV